MKRSRLLPFWLLLPALVVIGLVQLYPVLYTFWLSARRTEAGTGRQVFVGGQNFAAPAGEQCL